MKKKWLSILGAAVLTVHLAAGFSAFAANKELVISNCDTTKYWSASVNGKDALVLDTNNKTEGKAAVGAHAINGKLNQIQLILDEPIDISGYKYLEFDVYYSDMTWFNDCGGVMFEITSSGRCDIESNRWQKGVLRTQFEQNFIEGKDNWWHIKLPLAEPQSKANGGCKLSHFNFFRFYSVDPISTTPDYDIRIDNLKVTNNENPTPTEAPDEPKPTTPVSNPGQTSNNTDVTDTTSDTTSDIIPDTSAETSTDTDYTQMPSETTAEPADVPKSSSGGLSTGAIVGIVVAAVVVLGGGFAVYWFVLKKKK